jgi:hypothetical protein
MVWFCRNSDVPLPIESRITAPFYWHSGARLPVRVVPVRAGGE